MRPVALEVGSGDFAFAMDHRRTGISFAAYCPNSFARGIAAGV